VQGLVEQSPALSWLAAGDQVAGLLSQGPGPALLQRTLRQDSAEVTVLRPELDASGVIRPGPAALGAGAGQLLIPSDPTIAAIWKVSHITEASPGVSPP
jgi:hypothetical protein